MVTRRNAWLAVGLLTSAYLLSFIDRQVLALLIEPIKATLRISDTRFSLLTGLAFSLFFAIAGVPLGWASDRFNRNRVISAGILCWSLATIASGFAEGFGQLFLARMLVGIGEAALTPATYSLLADLVAPRLLGRAIAVFSMGSQFGAAAAYLLGGALIARLTRGGLDIPGLGALLPWQKLFALVGMPGLLLAPLILFVIRDPRGRSLPSEKPSLAQTWQALRPQRTFLLNHFAGFTLYSASFFSMMAWLPALMARRFGFGPAEVGWHAGLLVLFACPSGLFAAGWLTDRMETAGRPDATLRAAFVGMALMFCALVVVGLTQPGPLLICALSVALFAAPWPLVLATTSLQRAVAPRLRAQTTALFLLVANLIGQTGAISLVALITDHVWNDPAQIHRSLALVCCPALALAVGPLLVARRRYFVAGRQHETPPSAANELAV
jgi:MFS family permease